jgi:hypothetical protein
VSTASLAELQIAADPGAWRDCGLAVGDDGVAVVGGIALRLAGGEGGITGWALRGLPAAAHLDGLPTAVVADVPASTGEHPLGATAVDHVVVLTPDLDRTMAAFAAGGLEPRRVRDAGSLRQAFYVLGGALAEVAGPIADLPADAPARFWGLTLVVADLEAAVARLGSRTGPVREAVQPGRRIATLRREAGLGLPVALMSQRG